MYVGRFVGPEVFGPRDGDFEGESVGDVGEVVGDQELPVVVGPILGAFVWRVGAFVGRLVGLLVGFLVGLAVASFLVVGFFVGLN